MFELFMYVYSCNALSARFFAVDMALNSYFMIMIMILNDVHILVLICIVKIVKVYYLIINCNVILLITSSIVINK